MQEDVRGLLGMRPQGGCCGQLGSRWGQRPMYLQVCVHVCVCLCVCVCAFACGYAHVFFAFYFVHVNGNLARRCLFD